MPIYRTKRRGARAAASLLAPEVEAVQWFKNGDHPLDYADEVTGFETVDGVQSLRHWTGAEAKAKEWEGQIVRYFRRPDVPGTSPCGACGKTAHEHGWLDIGGPGLSVCPGDYVVTVPFDSGRPDRPRYTVLEASAFEVFYEKVAG